MKGILEAKIVIIIFILIDMGMENNVHLKDPVGQTKNIVQFGPWSKQSHHHHNKLFDETY